MKALSGHKTRFYESCVNVPSTGSNTVNTYYGQFFTGSALSHQLNPVPFNVQGFAEGISKNTQTITDCVEFEEIHLPFRFLDSESKAVPPREYWLPINDMEKRYLLSITVSNESS